MMAKKVGVILVHPASDERALAFDVFVHEKLEKRFEKLKESLYEVDCEIAERFAQKHPEMAYLGSQDLLHTPKVNFAVLKTVCELVREGFTLEYAGGEIDDGDPL